MMRSCLKSLSLKVRSLVSRVKSSLKARHSADPSRSSLQPRGKVIISFLVLPLNSQETMVIEANDALERANKMFLGPEPFVDMGKGRMLNKAFIKEVNIKLLSS